MGINGKIVCTLGSKSAPFRPTTRQMPNLALIETTRITVQALAAKQREEILRHMYGKAGDRL